ncbi:hypothetical protein D9611_000538 [Ephemerocybe angulata]|uniref:Hydrophobin n=1 Tax=Ephemerocybe angulata TaxID=980116 RepID=A0A8H5BNU9_9AGAR|nr:hypothetical protein D9611_000538 [Tulosesus angulatus]
MQFILITALALASVAVAIPTGGPTTPTPIPASQCTGPIQCCNSVQSAGAPAVATILGLGINVGLNVMVGLTCSPLSIFGIGENSCTGEIVCCTNNSFGGLIAIGCTVVDINL